MNILMWLKHPGARGVTFSKLYDDPEIALKALAAIRAKGWHSDGSMHGIDLRETVLTEADFSDYDLEEADFSEAELDGATFARANLTWANFTDVGLGKANFRNAILFETQFYESDLDGADFTGADLREAMFDAVSLEGAIITPEQLAQCAVLYNTKMPDGSTYDGRYRLEADLKLAEDGNRDLDSAFDMAEWYQVSMEDYERGQAWADENLAALLERIDAQHEQETLHYQDTEPSDDPDAAAETYDVELSYASGSIEDHISLITDVFVEPDQVQAYRRLGWNRDELLDMGAWISAVLLWLPIFATGLISFINLMIQLVSGDIRLDIMPPKASPSTIGYVLSVVLPPIVILIMSLFGFVLTGWSAGKRKASLLTHVANAFIYLIAFSTPNSLTAGTGILVGLILAYMTHLAVGTRRSRRLLLITAILLLLSQTPFYTWWYDAVLLPSISYYQYGIDVPLQALPTFESAMMTIIVSVTEAFLWVFLIRWMVRSLRTRITGHRQSGAIATILLAIYSALTILRVPVMVAWPYISDALNL